MTKRSTVTVRQMPMQGAAGSAGPLVIRAELLPVETTERVELIDVTDRLTEFVASAAVAEGVLSLWSLHTTCAAFINESQQALHADIKRVLEQMVERHTDWRHNDPEHSDSDRCN